MKKTISILLAMFMVMSMLALASPPVPKQVRGYFDINGVNVAGYVIEVENLYSGEILSGRDRVQLVTESGGFAFDLSWFEEGYEESGRYYPGDAIEVRAVGMESYSVRFNIDKDMSPLYSITISIATSQTDLFVKCHDGTAVRELSFCPPKPKPEVVTVTVETTKYVCEDGTEVDEASDCVPAEKEEKGVEWWKAVLGTLIIIAADLFAAFKWGKGFTSGLIKYWAKRDPKRAVKMLQTAMTKAKEGKYKR